MHIVETSRVLRYNVDDVGLTAEDDKEVIRVALVAAERGDVYVVATDRHFFEYLDLTLLCRKYSHVSKVKVVKPQDIVKVML